MPAANSRTESQRDSGAKPRIARNELPWENAKVRGVCGFGNPRYSRLGSLRYGLAYELSGSALAWCARLLLLLLSLQAFAAGYSDRFVWVFGWGLGNDSDVTNINRVLGSAAQHGLNGAVVSFGLDTLCKQDAAYFRRLEAVQQTCARDGLELIPAVFSIGYGGGILAHNPNLAEGLPVTDAPFVVAGVQAKFVPDPAARLVDGGFENFSGNKFPGFGFCDQPGEISFADTTVKHSGRASLRLENFASEPHGHGRVMQTVHVTPHRCYRVSLWVKTEVHFAAWFWRETEIWRRANSTCLPRRIGGESVFSSTASAMTA